ncbi:MAG: hypothetical protein H0T76_03815 [Nannocystis sp.]|nr:hypothetical protein [Nannocystis sp.]MBA3545589.1 hypothetical protein [Nannocystis sp.]
MPNATFVTPLRSLLALCTALALSACVLPTKLGEVTDGDDTAAEPSTSAGVSTTSGATEGATAGLQETGETTKPDNTTSTSEPEDTGDTGPAFGCEDLSEAECAAEPGCMTSHATPYAFEECPEGQVYLGCLPASACDLALVTVCREGTDEAYQLDNGCIPAGFVPCESEQELCGQDEQDCALLDEQACADDGDFCESIHGFMHVPVGDDMCVDFKTQIFLACVLMDGACPPFVPTVCPIGKPDQQFDVPSGCIPPGHEICDGAGTPQCIRP